MGNEARDIATSRIVEWMEERLCDKISCHQIAEEAVRRSFDAGYKYEPPADPEFDSLLSAAIEGINDKYRKEGYDAHESAIRTAAAALVGRMEKLFNNEDGIIYGEDDIKAEFDALKVALATGKEKKESAPVEHRTYCKHSYENGIDCPVCQGVPRLSDNSVEVSNVRSLDDVIALNIAAKADIPKEQAKARSNMPEGYREVKDTELVEQTDLCWTVTGSFKPVPKWVVGGLPTNCWLVIRKM